MKLLEYEAKNILHEAGVAVPGSTLVKSADATLNVPIVLKSQVPVGGRGKAGGVRVIESVAKLEQAIDDILQLAIKGFTPKVLLAEEKLAIKHEYYLSIVIDKPLAEIQLMAHVDGGVEVEENDPNSFLNIALDGSNAEPAGEQLAEYFDLPGQSFALQEMIERLYRCFIRNDATLLEINPLVYTMGGKLVAGDCKMELDNAAGFRHPEWEFEDKPADNNFVTLNEHGTVATIANGAGLAMATVDAVKNSGMEPANFLDIGGGANTESVLKAFRRIMEFPSIEAIVINIFAGITRCDEVARAVIAAKKEMPGLPPLFIRLAGTNYEEAATLLKNEHIVTLNSLEECLLAAKETTNG